jgi:uncharacterized membrane protein YidH (DUF202 family)
MNDKNENNFFDGFLDFIKGINLRDLIKTYIRAFVYLAVLLMIVAVIVVVLISVLHH